LKADIWTENLLMKKNKFIFFTLLEHWVIFKGTIFWLLWVFQTLQININKKLGKKNSTINRCYSKWLSLSGKKSTPLEIHNLYGLIIKSFCLFRAAAHKKQSDFPVFRQCANEVKHYPFLWSGFLMKFVANGYFNEVMWRKTPVSFNKGTSVWKFFFRLT